MLFRRHLHLAQRPRNLESVGLTHTQVRMNLQNSKALIERFCGGGGLGKRGSLQLQPQQSRDQLTIRKRKEQEKDKDNLEERAVIGKHLPVLFSSDEVLPYSIKQGGLEIPSYYSATGMAWIFYGVRIH